MAPVSRRQFIGGSLFGVAGLTTAGLLSSCAPSAKEASRADGASKQTLTANTGAGENPAWVDLNPQEAYDENSGDVSALFTEIQVGTMTLRNRICKASAGSDTGSSRSPQLTQNTIDYYGRIADGGAALVILEEGTVGGLGMNPFRPMVCGTLEEGIAEAQRIVDRVHEGGAYIGSQIGIGSPIDPGDVNAYSLEEIKRMVTGIGDSAVAMVKAGFDCVEIKGATTDGLNQFLARRINRREDEYGAATEENRVRFFREIVEEIRSRCGSDLNILVLINALEENDSVLGLNDGYITIDEAKFLAQTLENAGADMVQVRIGTLEQEANCWASDTMHCVTGAHGTSGNGGQFDFGVHFGGLMDGAHDGVGAFIPLASEVKSAISIPVGCASYMDPRIAPDLINNAVAAGNVDLVFMNRPLTVDPQLPNKLMEGRFDEIAPCTRCFHCHGKPYGEAEMCRVNPTTQFAYTDEFPEGYDLEPAQNPLSVMVVGGGPAGMEAASVAAERGHHVSLYEKGGSLGGLLAFADAVKGPHEHLAVLKKYLADRLDALGVEVNTNADVTAELVKEIAPDAVIVATGGMRETRFDGTTSMDDYASAEIGDRVIILGANLQATDVAQQLLAQGKHVTLINEKSDADISAGQSYWVRKYVKAHLASHGVTTFNNATIESATSSKVVFTTAAGYKKSLEADTVIECFDMAPNNSLAKELEDAGISVYRAACDNPSNIQNAIHEGYRVSRYLN